MPPMLGLPYDVMCVRTCAIASGGNQVIAKAYNKECDLWSLGVILFTLMCGYPPFWGDTEREIYGRVKRGHYAFEGPDWQVRSPAAKDLVNMLLVMQPSARYTVYLLLVVITDPVFVRMSVCSTRADSPWSKL